ncbi:nuclease-related domain-containing protein [Nocardia grenadensis]|uniref:nuclease-related domain-containing protein n=1 Tax=Nocardia grenadensis TaxID=931537 RepID=UPI0007A38ACD|nr:nuclease-related domain-containing protein [Nocardia grenadensis]
MLVIADKLRSGAEKRVVGWLRKWEGDYRVPGVAITNCFISGQEVDLVIITPYTTVVGEIKGIDPEVTGSVLQCTTNSRWRVPGSTGDPVSVRDNDTTPYDQVRDGVFKLKAAAGQVGGSAFVTGLVVVLPPRGSTMRLEKKSAPPPGCDVLLCNTQNPLRAWFHRAHHRSAVVWTAEQAYAVIEALEYGDRTTIAELADAGFPLDSALPAVEPIPLPPSAPDPVPASPRAIAPPPSAPARASVPPRPSAGAEGGSADDAPDHPVRPPDPSAAPPPPPPEPRPEPSPVIESPPVPDPDSADRRRARWQTAAAFAVIAVLGGGLWLMARGGGDAPAPREPENQQQISSVAEVPAAPPQPVAVTPAPPPRPAPPPICYPFQPRC